jgi:heme/copper-type cytochrome/quinol oxidase subunit 2
MLILYMIRIKTRIRILHRTKSALLVGYTIVGIRTSINFYRTSYRDKIEHITNEEIIIITIIIIIIIIIIIVHFRIINAVCIL